MNKKGFTLVELLGSITIIAVITLIIVPTTINKITEASKKLEIGSEILLYTAAEEYMEENINHYPKNGVEIDVAFEDIF